MIRLLLAWLVLSVPVGLAVAAAIGPADLGDEDEGGGA